MLTSLLIATLMGKLLLKNNFRQYLQKIVRHLRNYRTEFNKHYY